MKRHQEPSCIVLVSLLAALGAAGCAADEREIIVSAPSSSTRNDAGGAASALNASSGGSSANPAMRDAATTSTAGDSEGAMGVLGDASVDQGTPSDAEPRLGLDAGRFNDASVQCSRDEDCVDVTLGACSEPSTCDASGVCRPNYLPPGTFCGAASNGQCDGQDICDGNGNCLPNFAPVGAACSDGLFCTGEEACDGIGSCVSQAEPCLEERPFCDEEGNRCLECREAADCAGAVEAAECRRVACVSGECTTAPDLAVDGTDCQGGRTCQPSGPCTFEGNETCDETGTQQLLCITRTCDAGNCVFGTEGDSSSCTRDTTGTSCDLGTTCTGFGACQFDSICDETGTQSRTCTDRACSGDSCEESAPRIETRACTRDTDGVACGGETCGEFGACDYEEFCDEDAVQRRTCTFLACSGGACATSQRTESQSCHRPRNGMTCNQGPTCCLADTCSQPCSN